MGVSDTRQHWIFLLLYALSGAAALVYEVTWMRLLTLQMGQGVAATSTILAAFMGGLAVGSWIGGRVRSAGLGTYAALDLLVALAALAVPAGAARLTPILVWAYSDGDAPTRFALVRVGLGLLLIGAPALAMGATFPVAAAWFVRQADRTARRGPAEAARAIGALYAANTAGAGLGALAAGFWLEPALGLRGATWVGVLLNLASATGALTILRANRRTETLPAAGPVIQSPSQGNRASRMPRAREAVVSPPRVTAVDRTPQPTLAALAAAISGFVALAYEVGWTRLLALVLGPTTYAFATMASFFVIGLAIGSAAGTGIVRRVQCPPAWLALALILTALAASLASWFAASRLPLVIAAEVADPQAVFGAVILQQAVAVGLLLLPMTCALGAVFPLALAVASVDPGAAGRDAARVYAANTLGAIAGALVAGFGLLPALGLRNTFRAAAVVGLAASAGVWATVSAATVPTGGRARGPAPRRRIRAVPTVASLTIPTVALLVGAVVFFMPSWDLDLLSSGVYKYAPYIRGTDIETEIRAGRLLYYKDGAAATVSVRQMAGTRSLAIDGKVDASNAGDMLTQRLLGLLPMLLHPRPRNVCIIGLGSGVTVGSAVAGGALRRADVVEISPEVVEASAWFDKENGRVLRAPAARLIVGDGRSHLRLTTRLYDVIVSEPSNPWMSGVAALFTREFFEAARARLEPGGIMCQWAHTYDISATDLRSIVRTFHSVFPEATLWLVGAGDLLLIGTTGAAVDPYLQGLEQRARADRAASMLRDVAAGGPEAPFALFTMFMGGPAALERLGTGAPVQTDDRMALEFSAPRAIYGRSTAENARMIRALADTGMKPPVVRRVLERATDASWTAAGAMELKAEAFEVAYDCFQRAVSINHRNADALAGLSEAAGGAHRLEDARAWLQSLAAAEPDNAAVRIELSHLRAADGDFNGAIDAAQAALRLSPDDPRAGEQLASVLADAGDAGRLAPLAEALAARFPRRDKPRFFQASALFLQDRFAEAAAEARGIVARNPDDARAQNLLGAACAASGLRDCAEQAFEASLRANPRDAMTYVNIGTFHMQVADPATASRDFAVALALDPSSAAARRGLEEARAAMNAERRP